MTDMNTLKHLDLETPTAGTTNGPLCAEVVTLDETPCFFVSYKPAPEDGHETNTLGPECGGWQ